MLSFNYIGAVKHLSLLSLGVVREAVARQVQRL